MWVLSCPFTEHQRSIAFLETVIFKLAFYYFLCCEVKCAIWLQEETLSCGAQLICRVQHALGKEMGSSDMLTGGETKAQ